VTDIEIINRILAGDRNSYAILVERHQSMVFLTCMGFVHNKEDADDLTQEIFIQAYQALKSFKAEASFSTWLYRIAVNASLNRVRKTSKTGLFSRLSALLGNDAKSERDFPAAHAENPEEILLKAEQAKWVQQALDSLPEKQRTAIVLSKYDELSQKEIATIMDTTEGAVEALLQRAKANLREKLSSGFKKRINDRRKK
jgi:RNA polymerase sigma-70 factor (ECF subfamily)